MTRTLSGTARPLKDHQVNNMNINDVQKLLHLLYLVISYSFRTNIRYQYWTSIRAE